MSWKSHRELSAVQHRFRRVTSVRQLRRWARRENKGGTHMEKLHRITEYTLNNLKCNWCWYDSSRCRPTKWGLHAKNIIAFDDTRFKASDWWMWRFTRTLRTTLRKNNKFVTRKTLEDKEKLKVRAEISVNEVKPYITKYGTENVYSLDQSEFQLEMHSGRTTAIEGKRQVECVVQSISSTTLNS